MKLNYDIEPNEKICLKYIKIAYSVKEDIENILK